jgi:hypothetical protein
MVYVKTDVFEKLRWAQLFSYISIFARLLDFSPICDEKAGETLWRGNFIKMPYCRFYRDYKLIIVDISKIEKCSLKRLRE